MSVIPTVKTVQAGLTVAVPATVDATSMQSGDKFKAMMERPRMVAPSHDKDAAVDGVRNLVASQDAEMRQVTDDMTAFSARMPSMSLREIVSQTTKLTFEISGMELDMQAKMGVVESSRSAVETLMKNQ